MQVRCPHCQTPVELSSDGQLSDIACPSCGSSFSLLGTSETIAHEAGRRTIGHFELLDKIGVGTFGFVWKARDTELDRLVAVKIPRKGQLDPEETEQFLREARAAAQLRHPYIVSVHEVGREQDTVFIVSDFVEGVTLADRLTVQRYSMHEAAELCAKMAEALHHAHESGVIHRDLKPGNVILDAAGEPHIMDFGLARREAGEVTMTVEGRVLGTPAYMSPEQAKGSAHTADRRSDVYSLGVMLFEMLTGERPFRGNVRMLVTQVINDEPPSPRRLNASVPRDLETICLKCLEKDPGKRYATAAALAADLRRFQDGQIIEARPVSRATRLWRLCRRHRLAAGLTLAVVLSLVGGLAGVTWQWRVAAAQRNLAYRTSYFAHMRHAQQELDEGITSHLLDVLQLYRIENARSDLRGWEWYYLLGQCHNELGTIGAHTGRVTSLSWSPNGDRIASGGEDGKVAIWHVFSGTLQHVVDGHSGGVSAVAWSPDGNWVASGGADNTVRLWNAATGHAHRASERRSAAVLCLAWSSDCGKLVFGDAARSVGTWEVNTNQFVELLTPTEGRTLAVHYTKDGQHICAATRTPTGSTFGEGTYFVWDAASATLIRRGPWDSAFATSVFFGPDGGELAYAGFPSIPLLKLTGEADGRRSRIPVGRRPCFVDALAWSADGQLIATGHQDQTTRIFARGEERDHDNNQRRGEPLLDDELPSQLVRLLRGHTQTVTCLAWSSSRQLLASGCKDGSVKFWDAATDPRQIVLDADAPGGVDTMAWSPHGGYLASGSTSGRIAVWNVATRKAVLTWEAHVGPCHAVAWSPNGEWLASLGDDDTVKIWDAHAGRELRKFTFDSGGFGQLAWNPDSVHIAASREDSAVVRIWDATTGEESPPTAPHQNRGFAIAWSPDGNYLCTGRGLWTDWPEVPAEFTQNSAPTARIWDTRNRRWHRDFQGLAETVSAVAWSPDGNYVAMGCPLAVYLWNATTGEQHATLRGHVASVRSVAWSPDGRRLGSSGHDGTIRIWDPLAAQELISLPLSNEVRALKIGMCLRWSPDGKSLACAVTDGTIRVWDASRGYTLAEQPAGWQPPFTGIREFATSSGTTGDLSVGLDAPASIAPKRDR